MSEIFKAVKGENHILGFSKNEGNPNCPVGSNIKNNLGKLYDEMDKVVEEPLSKTTLEEFETQF